MAAATVTQFGVTPKIAFVSHSMYGSSDRPSARKMRLARNLFAERCPGIEADGEMQGDAALSEELRGNFLLEPTLRGAANVLILPNLDAANILLNVLKVTGGAGVTVGPILLGAAAPVHILTPSSTVRRLVNMTALAVAAPAPTPSGATRIAGASGRSSPRRRGSTSCAQASITPRPRREACAARRGRRCRAAFRRRPSGTRRRLHAHADTRRRAGGDQVAGLRAS